MAVGRCGEGDGASTGEGEDRGEGRGAVADDDVVCADRGEQVGVAAL